MPESERAQSEVVGFLLIFTLVILAILLVGITAITGLNDTQEFQETTSTEQAFVVLANNIGDVTRRGAPSRTTEIGLSQASLSVDETEQINITVAGETTRIETQPIVYNSRDDTSISYSSGMLIREDGGNGVRFREPNFVLTEEIVILPIVATAAVDDTTVGGTTAVPVKTRRYGTAVVAAAEFEGSETVTIEVSSSRSEIWADYLAEMVGEDNCERTNGSVRCSISTEQAFVSVEEIEVALR